MTQPRRTVGGTCLDMGESGSVTHVYAKFFDSDVLSASNGGLGHLALHSYISLTICRES